MVLARGRVARTLRVDVVAGAGGQLTHGRGRATHDLAHLLEGHPEHVVEHERRPLGRTKGS